MPEVFPKHVLLRVGGRTWATYGQLAMAGSGRHLTPVPIAHARADAATCAPFLGQDGKLYTAAANIPRIDYTPYYADGLTFTLPDGSVVPARGPLLEGSRTNICTWSDALSNWTNAGTPVVTDAFVTLGSLGLTLIEDDDAGVAEYKVLNVSFTGDGVKAVLFYARSPATPADGNLNRFRILDTTAVASRLDVALTWNGDGTLNTATASVGTLIGSKRLGVDSGGRYVYAFYCQTTSVTAANTNRAEASPSGFTASNVGKMVVGGVHVVNALFPDLHRIKTTGSAVTRAADSFTLPFNWGPSRDLTALARIYRPVWADVAGDIVTAPYIAALAGTVPRLEIRSGSSSRTWIAGMNTAGTDANAVQNIPSGAEQIIAFQYRALTTGGISRVDSGAGFTSETSAVTAFSAYGDQTLWVGRSANAAEALYGVLLDLMFLGDNTFSRSEASAVA